MVKEGGIMLVWPASASVMPADTAGEDLAVSPKRVALHWCRRMLALPTYVTCECKCLLSHGLGRCDKCIRCPQFDWYHRLPVLVFAYITRHRFTLPSPSRSRPSWRTSRSLICASKSK